MQPWLTIEHIWGLFFSVTVPWIGAKNKRFSYIQLQFPPQSAGNMLAQ